jgi:hypothetical protein
MGTVIQVKYSTVTAQPTSGILTQAELGYSYASGRLFIGSPPGNEPVPIGGTFYTDLLSATAGTTTAGKALVVDVNKWLTELYAGSIKLAATSGGTGQTISSISTSPTLSGAANTDLATSLAVKTYIDDKFANDAFSLNSFSDIIIADLAASQVLIFNNGSGKWENKSLSGHATINTSGTVTLSTTLDGTTGKVPGAYGSSTQVPTFTVDAQGRITAISFATISTTLNIAGDSGPGDTVSLLTDTLTISGGTGLSSVVTDNTITVNLDNTAVTPASYGSATAVSTFTVDQQGRITTAGSSTISIPHTQVNDWDEAVQDVIGTKVIGGTGVTVSYDDPGTGNTTLSIGQAVATTSDVTFNNLTLTGYLRGPSTFTIDPAAHGDSTGTVVIAGDLRVDGTTTTINSTEVTINDRAIILGNNATFESDLSGGGIILGPTIPGWTNASFLYASANDSWNLNKQLFANVTGNLTGNADTSGKWFTSRTVTFTGDVAGSFSIDGSGDVSNVSLTVQANSVALGTDTTGDYVASVSVTAGTGLSVTGTGEGAAVVLAGVDSTTTTKGVASFSSANFAVSSGSVTVVTIDGGTF